MTDTKITMERKCLAQRGCKITALAEPPKIHDSMWKNLYVRIMKNWQAMNMPEDTISYQIGDIVLVVYSPTEESDREIHFWFTRQIADSWNLNAKAVYDYALDNTTKSLKPKYFDYKSPLPYKVVTNTDYYEGAMLIFVPHIVDQIAEDFNDDLYIAFTSFHEAVCHPVTGIDPKDIQSVIQCMLLTGKIRIWDFLTDEVLKYDRDTKKIFRCRYMM